MSDAAGKTLAERLTARADTMRAYIKSCVGSPVMTATPDLADDLATAASDLSTLAERLRVAEEALEPFAEAAEDWTEMGDTRPISEDGRPTVGDLRRAASIRARGA